jgi:hypothetical protein
MNPMRILAQLGVRHALEDLHASSSSEIHEGGIEISTRCDSGEESGRRKRKADFASRWRSQPSLIDVGPVGDGGGVESENFEFAQCESGEAVAAALVSRK